MKLLAIVALAGCSWDLERMNDQPRCEPGDRRPWLPDERCDQAPPAGTVPSGAHEDMTVPPPTRELILRGQDRFARVCAPCHGVLGDGQSAIARDMSLRKPPSLYEPRIIADPDRRLFEVIEQGYGMMPSYTLQLRVRDRWAVVYFVRALQRSQAVPLAELSPERQQEASRWLK